jgi:RNA polymerase sigma-70 factor (ECF subfamily)
MSIYESGMVLGLNGAGFQANVTTIPDSSPKPVAANLTLREPVVEETVEISADRRLDQALVERVQQGDKRAYDVLVQKYQQRIIRLLSRFIRNPDEVLDVAQETFIKAYRAINGFRGDAAFYTWLYRIAINTAKNYLVSSERKMLDASVDADDAEQFEAGDWLREHATPERELMAAELKQVIFNAISHMPEELKEAITLRELENLSYEDIAQVMDCPIGTVRSRIFRAREIIDQEIRPLLERG